MVSSLGDVFLLSSLTLAYKDKLLLIKEQRIVEESEKDELLNFNETEKSQIMFDVFDQLCEHALLRASCGLNDYNQPIFPIATFDDFVSLAEHALPRVWRHFCSLIGASQIAVQTEIRTVQTAQWTGDAVSSCKYSSNEETEILVS